MLQSFLTLPSIITSSPLLSILTPIAAGAAVSLLTGRHRIKDTYQSLRQPPGAPPSWLFGPVWTTLYGMMGYASYRISSLGLSSSSSSSSPPAHIVELALSSQPLYTSQLALNLLWTPLFFGLRSPALALVDISALIANVAILVSDYAEVDRVAAWLLVPYLAWLGYATYLNAAVGALNRWRIAGGSSSGSSGSAPSGPSTGGTGGDAK